MEPAVEKKLMLCGLILFCIVRYLSLVSRHHEPCICLLKRTFKTLLTHFSKGFSSLITIVEVAYYFMAIRKRHRIKLRRNISEANGSKKINSEGHFRQKKLLAILKILVNEF